MASAAPPDPLPRPSGSRAADPLPWLMRLPTGAKLFLILSLCLLPLALIAMAATLQTTRLADAEALSRLRVASIESARAIAIELVGDMTALSATTRALSADPGDTASCARAEGVFTQPSSAGTRFAIVDRTGRLLCGQPVPGGDLPRREDETVRATVLPDRGVILAMRPSPAGLTARAYFPVATLTTLSRPTSRAAAFDSTLALDGRTLTLDRMADIRVVDRVEKLSTDIGIAGLTLETATRSAPISSSLVVAMLLPLLMWIAAASISWLIVDRLLIRPLRRLRTSVAAFTPGEVIDTGAAGRLPAAEIRELGDTFRAISRTVAIHEAGLAEGLVRQTKLTREVHHRVKNNLQVISSLINFHARGAPSPDATAAYSSIQRRVDALAVVHRNHFAENEENRGLNLRTMLGELASNIRATAPEGSAGLGISLDVEPLMANQDVAVAIAFLVTETIELALSCDPAAQVRIAVRAGEQPDRAVLRVISRALIESDVLRDQLRTRYGRVIEGLSRQLRAPLHHDPLAGAYEIGFAILGRA
jgi:two-component sensor histidine kinase